MKLSSRTFIIGAIVVAEIVSIGLTTTASAESASQERRQIRRQQQVILQQQRQIRENQRLLEMQQRQIGQQPTAAPPPANRNLPRGLLGDIGGCPIGYTYSLFYGCLPHVIVN